VGRPVHPPRWGGAIAGWELTRLARRGSPTIARLLVALFLFAALLITYLAAFPDDVGRFAQTDPGRVQAQLAAFGQKFSLTLLLVQAAVAWVLTPLFVAGSIVEETERRTLEFLLATDLRSREIILGKLWPRLLLVFGVVLVGWPVLAVTEVWGGVDPLFVGLGSLVVLVEIWAVAGISAACAVGTPTLGKALVRSYAWSIAVIGLPLVTCPFGVITALADTQGVYDELAGAGSAKITRGGGPYGPPPAAPAPAKVPAAVLIGISLVIHFALQFAIGTWGVARACRKLYLLSWSVAREQYGARPKREKWEQHPPVPEGSPLLWKEVYLSGQTARFVRLLNLVPWGVWLGVTGVFMLVGFAAVQEASDAEEVLDNMNGLVRWGGGLAVGLMAVTVGLHAAGSVARERQQETLSDLLTIPRSRSEILTAKWIGSMLKARAIAFGAAAIPAVGVITYGLSYWAVVPMLAAAFAFLACAASFGLWLSVRTATVQRATGLWLLIVGLWVGGTLLAAEAAYMEGRASRRWMTMRFPPERPAPLVWDRALNPALAWSELTFRRAESPTDGLSRRAYEWTDGVVENVWSVWPSALGVGVYAFLAWAFYAAAERRFEREGRG
jgi:ABC-type transport system involved in multi-copper enzyme maturation permease subunit